MKNTQFAEDLREALGAESAGKWLEFMDRIQSSLEFLLGAAGRPTKEQIDSSVIGTAGFESWTQMIETSPVWGGLGWSVDSWKSWKRAYAVVQKNLYLREMSLTASEINTLSREFKPFPASLEAFEAAKAARSDRIEASRGNSIAALKSQLTAAQSQVSTLTAKSKDLQTGIEDAHTCWKDEQKKNEALNNHFQQVLGKLETAKTRVSELEKAAKTADKGIQQKDATITKQKQQLQRYSEMTWMDHLKAIFANKGA
jgi:uncharacterized phage infection (PIP) family protein YhgE